MADFRILFNTPNQIQVVFNTTISKNLATTNSTYKTLFSTTLDKRVFVTPNNFKTLFTTSLGFPYFVTPGNTQIFFTTGGGTFTKELVPKITTEFSTDATSVVVSDATGDYDPAEPTLNPGGYNVLPEPFNPYRPYRDDVYLWTVYRIWDVYGSATQTPATQTPESDVPYEYTLPFPTTTDANGDEQVIKGIYELIMIAAPDTENYSDYVGNPNLYDIANELPDWFSTGMGIMVDNDVYLCIQRRRYAFLQEVMCGKCDEGYLNLYSLFVAMLSALEIQNWPAAIEFYNKLKEACAEDGDSCGCNC